MLRTFRIKIKFTLSHGKCTAEYHPSQNPRTDEVKFNGESGWIPDTTGLHWE